MRGYEDGNLRLEHVDGKIRVTVEDDTTHHIAITDLPSGLAWLIGSALIRMSGEHYEEPTTALRRYIDAKAGTKAVKAPTIDDET